MVIDLFGTTPDKVLTSYPELYQHVLNHVKPERDQNRDKQIRENWWLHGRPRPELRSYISGLPRYIATVETSKHRFFTFLDQSILPDNRLVCFALSDAYQLAILSSFAHLTWALGSGGRLEDRPVYNKSRCFEPFPFPALEESPLKQRIRDLGERLDAHRKARQAAHPELTLTGMYNVLEKLRAGEPLNDKEKKIHDDGLVTLLKQIHDDLDAAVYEAYGWEDLKRSAGVPPASSLPASSPPASSLPASSPSIGGQDARAPFEEELLTRLVALNHERAEEEKRGLIRWLRPEYQACSGGLRPSQDSGDAPSDAKPSDAKLSDGHRPPLQENLPGTEASAHSAIPTPQAAIAWPSALSEQVTAIQHLLPLTGPDPTALAAHFGKRTKARVQQISEILKTLEGLGKL